MRVLWLVPLLLCFIFSSVKAAACPDRCKTCDSSKKCTSCERGNILVNSKCDGCVTGCDKCTVIATQGTAYWTKCIGSCQTGCSQCNSDYTCGKCSRGYGPYEGQCLSCQAGCDKCTVTQVWTNQHDTQCTGSCQNGCSQCNSDYTCAQCSKGYGLINGMCRSCQGDCDKCYFTSSNEMKCTGSCKGGCDECSNGDTCTRCRSGYVLNDGMCKSCQGDCDKCYFTSSNEIKCTGSCKGGCDECSGGNTCTRCRSGYVLNDGVCYACNGCSQCNFVQVTSSSYRTECIVIPPPTPTPTPEPTPTPTPTPNNNNNIPTPSNSSSGTSYVQMFVIAGVVSLAIAAIFIIKRNMKSQRTNVQQDYARAMAAEKQRQAALNVPPQNYQYRPPQAYPQGYPQGYNQGYPQAYPQAYPQGYPQGYPQSNQPTQ